MTAGALLGPALSEVPEDVVGDGSSQPGVNVLPGLARSEAGRHSRGRALVEITAVEAGQSSVQRMLRAVIAAVSEVKPANIGRDGPPSVLLGLGGQTVNYHTLLVVSVGLGHGGVEQVGQLSY